MICEHCSEVIYLSGDRQYYHELTRDRHCLIERPVAKPLTLARVQLHPDDDL